ncbi:MAG: PH domain-containing protein [Acidimicrobiales bacterium]
MTMVVEPIVIRPPLVSRVYVSLFGVLWLAIAVFTLVSALDHGTLPGAAISLGLLAAGGFVILSNITLRVVADGDELRVRNLFRDERYARSQIERFVEHHTPAMPKSMGGMIAVVLRDGRLVDMRATSRGPLGRAQRDEALRRLRAWLEAGSLPPLSS